MHEVIEQGQITLENDPQPQNYVMRVLGPDDLRPVMALQERVIEGMENRELYMPIPEGELRVILAGHGESLGLFIEDRMYAACSLLFRVEYENNMGRELGFGDGELARVAQLELSLVDARLRGHKLQCRMAGILISRLASRGTSRYIFTTVSPYNYASIQTVTALGLQITKLSKMYFGWDRYVVYRDLIQPVKLDTDNPISIANTALSEQQDLLDEGYRGFSQYKDQEGIKIMYAKMI